MTILFPQVVWDAQDLMFSMPEPGVYMLQMGGSISGANVVAKMVNDDVEAEVVTLEGTKDTVFRCRSTIFTVEDDDHEAERLLVEVSFVNIIILFAHTPEWAFDFWHQFRFLIAPPKNGSFVGSPFVSTVGALVVVTV